MSTDFSDEEIIAICKDAFPGLAWDIERDGSAASCCGVSPVLEVVLLIYEKGSVVEAGFREGEYIFRSANKSEIPPSAALHEIKGRVETFLNDLRGVMGV